MTDTTKLFNPDAIKNIKAEKKAWQEQTFGSQKEQNDDIKMLSGIPIQPLYTPADISDLNYKQFVYFHMKSTNDISVLQQ